MNNNNMGRVAVRTSRRKRSATPIPYDVNSTFGVGAIKPLMIREVIPNSSISVKTRNLIRLATMNVPTYGRLKLNLRHYFVGMSDLTKNFGALMAEQVISRAHGSFKPISLPRMTKGFLNLFSLVGAHVSLYRAYNSSLDTSISSQCRIYKVAYQGDLTGMPEGIKSFWKSQAYQNLSQDTYTAYNNGDFYKQSMPADWREAWNGYDGPALNICKLMYGNSNFGSTQLGWEFWIPIENKDWTTFFNITAESVPVADYINTSVVPLDKADAVLSVLQRGTSLNNGEGQLACRFSNFGIRWRDLMIMSGTGIDYNDWNSSGFTSLMPIFAYYKAYWESFGLELYKKWETSSVVKMMCVYDDQNEYDFEDLVARTSHKLKDSTVDIGIIPQLFFQYWCNFVCDVGTAFYTEEKDFTSIHTRDAVVSSNANIGSQDVMAGVPNTPMPGTRTTNTSQVTESGTVVQSPVSYPVVNSGLYGQFSQLDVETLKRMYKVVNRNTIAGQNIAKLLELQGLGDYVESCKSRFIGEYDVPIDIDEVTATADAFDADGSPRSLLGAQGAKGVGFGASKRFKVTTNEFGYFVVLSAIVPESGYINLASASARNLRKTQFYNPEWDGVGMELNTKELTVTGEQDWSDSVTGSHLANSSFGFAPQYSRHKVQGNYALSGMSLRSERDYFRSYFLDKCIDVGERSVKQIADTNGYIEYSVVKTFTVDKTPIASPNWQFVGRYPWIENYLRIFAETGDPLRKLPQYYASLVGFVSTLFDFTIRDADKFIVQNRFIAELSCPWLKITDAYETKEDGNVGSTDVSIGKA